MDSWNSESATATGTRPLMTSGLGLHTVPGGAGFDLGIDPGAAPDPSDAATAPVVATLPDVPAGLVLSGEPLDAIVNP